MRRWALGANCPKRPCWPCRRPTAEGPSARSTCLDFSFLGGGDRVWHHVAGHEHLEKTLLFFLFSLFYLMWILCFSFFPIKQDIPVFFWLSTKHINSSKQPQHFPQRRQKRMVDPMGCFYMLQVGGRPPLPLPPQVHSPNCACNKHIHKIMYIYIYVTITTLFPLELMSCPSSTRTMDLSTRIRMK